MTGIESAVAELERLATIGQTSLREAIAGDDWTWFCEHPLRRHVDDMPAFAAWLRSVQDHAREPEPAQPIDDELLGLSMFLEPGIGARLRQLVDAAGRVHLVVDLEHQVQRANDLERELRRHLASLEGQLHRRGEIPASVLNEPT